MPHEDKELFDVVAYAAAVEGFVDYLLQIAYVAMRMLARHRKVGINDFNRDPNVVNNFWHEADKSRLAYLHSKRSSAK